MKEELPSAPRPALPPTCVPVQDLAVGRCQLKHLQLGAVGGHNDVRVTRAQELHIQHLLVVSCELQGEQPKREEAAEGEGGSDWFSSLLGVITHRRHFWLSLFCFLVPLLVSGQHSPKPVEFSGPMEQFQNRLGPRAAPGARPKGQGG